MITTTFAQFAADLEELAVDLVEAYDLKFSACGTSRPEQAMYRWMDYRLRHVPHKPRVVHKSPRFPVQNLPDNIAQALAAIEARFVSGEDVNPYLSKTTVGNDTSTPGDRNDEEADRRARAKRTDGLWADWRIHHFHLTIKSLVAGERFSKRSGWLLFAMVFEDAVAFIDVRKHDSTDLWTQHDLVKTFIEAWPEQAEPYRIAGMSIEPRSQTAVGHKLLREATVNTPVEHNGQHYLGPGGGLTMGSTSSVASMAVQDLFVAARNLAAALDDADHPLRVEILKQGSAAPQFFLGVGEAGLVLGDRSPPQVPWLPPEKDGCGQLTLFGRLREGLLPAWAVPVLLAHLRSKS